MVGKKTDTFKKVSSDQILDSLIFKAIETNASFIHIEPRELDVLVRFRVNGALIEINKFPKSKLNGVNERIKKLANLDTSIRDIPQDGRFKSKNNDDTYTLRVSILPTIDGEKISINILNGSTKTPDLRTLGYWGHGLKAMSNAAKDQNGVILISGPRDSGKSLSLVSMLNNIDNPDKKIATIEDPVEYILKKAHQTQVNHKTNLSFVNGLKAIEKQDNDVIMVSEIRDSEVANLVFHYGSRGKLVLSSIYSNSITDSINKLLNVGISRSEIAHTLRLVSSQRLVRKLCENCRESFEPDKSTLALINEVFGLKDPGRMKYIHKLETEYYSDATGNEPNIKDLSTTENRIKKLWRINTDGCEKCLHTGYVGRIGLYEIINMSPAIRKLILSLASSKVLFDKAVKEGTVSILTDGLVKSLQGVTSINEVFRLIQENVK